MKNFKLEAAKAALTLIQPGQTIGLGAGSTIAHLSRLIAEECEFRDTLTFTSSSFSTFQLLTELGLNVQAIQFVQDIAIYFDGCDHFDPELNALKSGGGIHSTEKILATAADEFILIGDTAKYTPELDTTYPLVLEVIPHALQFVVQHMYESFPVESAVLRISKEKDGAVITDQGNMLVDIYFTAMPDLEEMNIAVKMIPGLVDHSLFYKIATKAIIAGEDGVQYLTPAWS